MKKLKIILRLNGKKKKYLAPNFISSDVFWKTLELEEDLKSEIEPSIIFDKCIPLICAVFGDQFTELQARKGLDIRDILPLTNDVIHHVISFMELDCTIGDSKDKKVVIPIENKRKTARS